MAIDVLRPYQELSSHEKWCVDQVLQLSREIPVLARAIFEKLLEGAKAGEGSIEAVSAKGLLREYDFLLFKKISGIRADIFPAHFDQTSLTPYRKSIQIDRDFIAFFESIIGDGYYDSQEPALLLPEREEGTSISNYAQSVREWLQAQPECIQQIDGITIVGGNFGSIPPEIRCFVNLTALSIEDTPLRELPEELASLKKLVALTIQNSALSKRPPVLDKLTTVEKLVLENNPFNALSN